MARLGLFYGRAVLLYNDVRLFNWLIFTFSRPKVPIAEGFHQSRVTTGWWTFRNRRISSHFRHVREPHCQLSLLPKISRDIITRCGQDTMFHYLVRLALRRMTTSFCACVTECSKDIKLTCSPRNILTRSNLAYSVQHAFSYFARALGFSLSLCLPEMVQATRAKCFILYSDNILRPDHYGNTLL